MTRKPGFLFFSSTLLLLFIFLQSRMMVQTTSEIKNRTIEMEQRIEDKKVEFCTYDIRYDIQLNDRVIHYLEESYLKGTQEIPKKTADIRRLYRQGALVLVEPNEFYLIDTMYYSYSFLTPSAKELLDEIGERFQNKLANTGLECTRFTVTSMLRTTSSVKRLQRWNRNSIKHSSHLHGTTFDVSYRTFFGNRVFTKAECMYLGDILAKTIWDLRREKKCYATYETWQTCFHVVCR